MHSRTALPKYSVWLASDSLSQEYWFGRDGVVMVYLVWKAVQEKSTVKRTGFEVKSPSLIRRQPHAPSAILAALNCY